MLECLRGRGGGDFGEKYGVYCARDLGSVVRVWVLVVKSYYLSPTWSRIVVIRLESRVPWMDGK